MDWNEIVTNAEDVNDPGIYEKVLVCLDDIYCEDEDFMQLLISKLDDMEVTWYQPWYQTSNCLTRCPVTNDHDENLEKFRTDHFTKKESEQIKKNWAKFIEEYDVPDKLLSFARWKTKDCKSPNTPYERVRRFVTAYLAQDLKRNNYQVYQYIVKHIGVPVKGPYSKDEEKLFDVCFCFNPKDAVKNLSLLLGRSPRGIYKRLRQVYDGKPEKKRLKWTLPLASNFLKLLLKYSECSLEELKYKRFEKSVWLNLEKEMEQQYQYLQSFWYGALHVQIFVKQDLTLIAALADVGYKRTLRKLLLDPKVKFHPDALLRHCERFADEKKISALETVAECVKDLRLFNVQDLYNLILDVYQRDNNYRDGLALWCKMQEADVTPSQKFIRNLCSLCAANHKEIPSDLAVLLDKETRQATS